MSIDKVMLHGVVLTNARIGTKAATFDKFLKNDFQLAAKKTKKYICIVCLFKTRPDQQLIGFQQVNVICGAGETAGCCREKRCSSVGSRLISGR